MCHSLDSIRRVITVSQSIVMAVWFDITVLQSIEKPVRRVLQSKEMAVRRCKTVSQPIEIALGEIYLCHSQ